VVRVVALVALLGLGGAASTSAAEARAGVPVFFLQGEQLKQVTRTGTSPTDAVRQLVAGPTRAEKARGIRTYVPSGTTVRRVKVAGGLATVDVGGRFTVDGSPDGRLARLAQLVRTVTFSGKATRVQLLVEGQKVTGVFPGVRTESPITFRFLRTPSVPVPAPPAPRRARFDPALRNVQRQLIALDYLPAGSADGRAGPMTQEAVLAFQKWERLPRTDVLDAKTKARLATAVHPAPITKAGAERRLEVLLDRQLTLLIENNRVVSAIAVSTGKPSTPTPPGHYRVYAKIPRWWSTPFREWLPWAVPFDGGIAFHQYLTVPTYAASHGCVRQLPAVAKMTFDFADVGMSVDVLGRT
jgi:N-acetylmuramoyl-L-alanine amidase